MATAGLRALPIAVSRDASVTIDFWAPASATNVRAHFCTHAHADHVVGLGRRGWSPARAGGKIFCTEITREVLVRRWPTLGRHARALEVGEPTAIRLTANTTVTVTLIDAGHCPGSAMVLIDGPRGRVLHTGDFRREDFGTRAALPRCVTRAPIDALYLDNTYAHPTCVFPDRGSATAEVIALCEANMDRPIVLGVDSLGKEDLACAVSEAVGCPVELADNRYLVSSYARFMHGTRACEKALLITRSANEALDARARTNIRCVPKQHVRPSTLRSLAAGLRHEDAPPLAILPTGWSAVRDRSGTATGTGRVDDDGANAHGMDVPIDENAAAGRIVSVAYSLHAPYNELEAFVRAVRPGCVMGNTRVNGDAEEVHDPLIHFGHLCTGEFSEGFYPRDADAPIPLDELGGRALTDFWSKVKDEHGVLKSRVNVEDVTIKPPKVPDKPSVRLAAAENGVVFEPPKKMTWLEREAKIRQDWDARCQRAFDIITAPLPRKKATIASTDDDNARSTKKRRAFVPDWMAARR